MAAATFSLKDIFQRGRPMHSSINTYAVTCIFMLYKTNQKGKVNIVVLRMLSPHTDSEDSVAMRNHGGITMLARKYIV
jgi:hypothetical protein